MPALLRSSLVMLLATPAPLFAQASDVRTVVMAAQPGRYEPAACGIKTGHFKVGSGATYLSTAITNEANRARLIVDAQRVLVEAIAQNGQAENPAAWYYLGRAYLYDGNVIGADTAFMRAEKLAPACGDEILAFRRATAAALQEPAGLLLQAEKNDSALVIYRLATRIYPTGTGTLTAVASLFEAQGKTDSAIVYYRKAASAGPAGDRAATMARARVAAIFAQTDQTDSAVAYYTVILRSAEAAGDTDVRNTAAMNLGMVLYNGKRYQEAIPVFRRYLVWRPDLMAARQYLASAFRETGMVDSADAVMRESGAAAGMGGSRPDTLSAAYLINRGAARYQANEHARAAEDFALALEDQPGNRLALRNLASTYYTLKNGEKLADAAGRIVALEPLSESARRLQIQGYLWLNDRAKLETLSDELDAMLVSFEDVKLQPTGTGATISGTATGRKATRNGAAIAPAPVVLVFEFLNAGGTPVSTAEVTVPVLMAGLPSPVSAAGSGQGIIGWRYTVKK